MQSGNFDRVGDRIVKMTEDKIDNIFAMVKEIHQRQEEVVMTGIKELKKDIHGNGKLGLLDRVTKLETIFLVLAGLITVGSGYIAFVKHW